MKMILDFNYIDIVNDIGYFFVYILPYFVLDSFSLYLLFGVIITIGLIPLIYFMSGGRIGSKILDIGSKVGSIVGAGAGVASVIQNSKGNRGSSGGDGNKSGGNKGGDNKESGDNKGGDSGGKK